MTSEHRHDSSCVDRDDNVLEDRFADHEQAGMTIQKVYCRHCKALRDFPREWVRTVGTPIMHCRACRNPHVVPA